jgi:fructose-1,6-bisphosphatase/inositol monophosphatase family enzyme
MAETPEASLDRVLEVAQGAALLAGAKIREALSTERRSEVKVARKNKNSLLSTDLVTETDRRTQDQFCQVLKYSKVSTGKVQ